MPLLITKVAATHTQYIREDNNLHFMCVYSAHLSWRWTEHGYGQADVSDLACVLLVFRV